MNKKRLYRSSDTVISGVCGGIAEYFGIDSTLVRIIAIALALIGLGFPVIIYVVLMVVLPPDPGIAQGYVDARAETTETHGQRVFTSSTDYSGSQPPPPNPNARTSTHHVSAAAAAAARTTASTASSSAEASAAGGIPRVASVAKNHSQAVMMIGAVLIGVGIIALLCTVIHISIWRFWPLVLVVVGAMCLFTPGSQGWSLERAGHAIILMTVGLVLLAWMLQIVQTRVFITAFWALWPMLLIILGVSIIGSARKSNAISLASSLLFSATVLFAVWFYGGLHWASLDATLFLIDTDGINEFLSDITMRN